MRDPTGSQPDLSPAAVLLRLGVIGAVVLCLAAAFAFTGGWFSPARLTQDRIIAGFEEVNGLHPGFRRNHAKGICATGWFESNGKAVSLSKAAVFAPVASPSWVELRSPEGCRSSRTLPPRCAAWRCGFCRRTVRNGAPV
jgi:catalase